MPLRQGNAGLDDMEGVQWRRDPVDQVIVGSPSPKVQTLRKQIITEEVQVQCPTGTQAMVQDGFLRCVDPASLRPQPQPAQPPKANPDARHAIPQAWRVGISFGAGMLSVPLLNTWGLGVIAAGALTYGALTLASLGAKAAWSQLRA